MCEGGMYCMKHVWCCSGFSSYFGVETVIVLQSLKNVVNGNENHQNYLQIHLREEYFIHLTNQKHCKNCYDAHKSILIGLPNAYFMVLSNQMHY